MKILLSTIVGILMGIWFVAVVTWLKTVERSPEWGVFNVLIPVKHHECTVNVTACDIAPGAHGPLQEQLPLKVRIDKPTPGPPISIPPGFVPNPALICKTMEQYEWSEKSATGGTCLYPPRP
jgi:hypothetical protein